MRRCTALVVVLAACGSSKSATVDAPPTGRDATAHDARAVDAAPGDAPIDAPLVHHGTAASFLIYVQTEGETVRPAPADDATMARSELATNTTGMTAYQAGQGDRATNIAAFLTDLRALAAPYDLTFVTTRPAATEAYAELVLTSSTGAAFGAGGSPIDWTPPADCATPIPHAMLFVFEPGLTPQLLADAAMAALGSAVLIPLTSDDNDCMDIVRAWSGACSIGGAGTTVDETDTLCPGPPTMIDENARWLAAYGAHQ